MVFPHQQREGVTTPMAHFTVDPFGGRVGREHGVGFAHRWKFVTLCFHLTHDVLQTNRNGLAKLDYNKSIYRYYTDCFKIKKKHVKAV